MRGGEALPNPNFLKPKPQPYKTVILLGFCRNMAGVPQSQPKNHQKSDQNQQSPKKWDFSMNK